MKRRWIAISLILPMAIFLAAIPSAKAEAADQIAVLVNGQPLVLEVAPMVEAERTLVPVRAIAESLGASVGWDPVARRVEIALNQDNLVLVIDSDIAYVNGVPQQLDAPARIVDGRTLVPLRFIGENLHAEVGWDAPSRTVSITSYVNAAPYSAALAQLESAVLQELNQRRQALGHDPLLLVDDLSSMARSHAAELAQNAIFTHVSPRFGDTAARATARGLTVHVEYLALGLPDAASIVDYLLRSDQGERLLAEEARFCGLGLYKAAAAGNANIYAVAELTEGLGFIQGAHQRRLDTANITLSGYAVAGAPLTLYLLNDGGDYLSRQSYTLNVDGSNRFCIDLSLPQTGRYTAVLGKDSVLLQYN